MKRHLVFAAVLAVAVPLQAIEVTQQNDLAKLTDAFLSSGGVSNASYSGDNVSVGTYTNNSGLWGLSPGMVLSSGKVTDYSDGPNTSGSWSTDLGRAGDPDLTALAGHPTYDAASLSFNFTAASNKISYNFLFGSEEYPEWVGSQYNDTFGAWLTDKSGTKTQLSFDKSGKPITVNTAWIAASPGTQLDGTTGLLQTTANVVKGQKYNLKVAVADTSDHVWDSTVYLSNFQGAAPNVYGLFMGVKDGVTNPNVAAFRGDLLAQNISDVVSQNVPGYQQGVVLKADIAQGGISPTQVQSAIQTLQKAGLKSGDRLILYSDSHGGSDYGFGVHGPEFLGLAPDPDYLTDDALTSYLSELSGVDKWVMLDACRSGGFWGDTDSPSNLGNLLVDPGDLLNSNDDLSSLSNIGLLAAAAEDKDAHYDGDTGLSYWGSALIKALSKNADGYLNADTNPKDGDLTWDELSQWMSNPANGDCLDGTVVYKQDLGDPVIFNSGMWSSQSFASADFGGVLLGSSPGGSTPVNPNTGPVGAVPAPGAILLGALGAGLVGWLRRGRRL